RGSRGLPCFRYSVTMPPLSAPALSRGIVAKPIARRRNSMDHALPAPDLGLSPVEASAHFDELQKKLGPLGKSIESFNQDEQTIVIVPSMNIDSEFTSTELQAYEERFLFLLLLLRQPRARVVYVTSQAILPSIIDYYLDLLPGVIASHAKRRLFLVAP